MAKYTNYLLLLPGLITSGVFVLAPSLIMILMSFYKQVGLAYEASITLENYVKFFASPQAIPVLLNTFSTSLLTCLICLIIAYPFAYFLTFRVKSQKLKTYAINLLLTPFLIDWTIRSVAWISVLGEGGLLNYILLSLRVVSQPVRFLFSREALYVIWTQTNLLFMIFPIYLALNRIDPDLINAAKVLKAPPHRVLYDIVFKLSLPGVICGIIFVFVSTLGDFVTPGLWAGGLQVLGLSVATYSGNFLWPQAATLGTILLLVSMAVLYILLKIVNIKKLIYE